MSFIFEPKIESSRAKRSSTELFFYPSNPIDLNIINVISSLLMAYPIKINAHLENAIVSRSEINGPIHR